MNLTPRTDEDRFKLLEEENEILQKKINSILFRQTFSMPLKYLKFWEKRDKRYSTNATTDSYNHSVVKPKEIIEAEFADSVSSNSSQITKINNAGLLFIKIGECPPINKLSRNFTQKLKSYSNVLKLIEEIVDSLKTVFTASEGGPVALLINSTDLKSSLLQSVNAILDSKSLKDKMEQHFHVPLITKENAVAWMKFDYSAEITAEEKCFFGKKIIEIDFTFYSFYFPTIEDFEDALKNAEKAETKMTSKLEQ